MKKILIITLEYPPQIGGIATYVHTLAEALATDKVFVLAPGGNERPPTLPADWDSRPSYKIIRKKLLFPRVFWPRWLRLVWHVLRVVKKEGIEIIFVQHVLPVGYAAIVMKVFFRIPFLLFSHGTDLLAGTATWWKKKLVTMVSQQAGQIIFNSESLRRRWLRVLPEFENKSLILYPCPDPRFFVQPAVENLTQLRAQYALEGKQVLLSIARLDEGKGFPHLIRVLPQILRKAPHLVWLIIGDGPKKQLVMKLIQANDLQNIVRFVGEVPHHELPAYYYLADVFVLLTHPDDGREEGLGLVFLEAAAAALPIVAGRSGGVEEAVSHTQTGLIVDAYQDKETVSAILELLNNRAYAARLGQAARERAAADFRWEHQVKKLEPWIR